MNILITGANGFIGRALSEYLSKAQHSVFALVRTPHPDLQVQDQFIVCDFLKQDDWSLIFKGIDVVIHLAGIVHTKGLSVQDYDEINSELTKKLATECVKAGVKRFVFISTVNVHGCSSSKEILTIKSPTKPLLSYGKSKLQAEEILRDIEKKDGLDVVIIRPPVVYGPYAKGNVDLLIKAIQMNIPFPFAGVKNRRSLIYLDNLVDAIALTAIHPDAKGHTYYVSDDHSLCIVELIQKLGKGLEKSPLLFPFPQILLRVPLKLLGKEEMLEKITGSLELDISDIKTSIGWKPVVSVEEGLRRTVEAFR